jgi:dipeptidyl aminopeptidase/acylaminoacyl peptidase
MRWRRRLIAAGASLLLIGLVLLLLLMIITVQIARGSLTPPRLPIEQTPRDFGIQNYTDISFIAADGIALRGWYIPPQNGAVIILAHGYAANRELLLPEAQILAGHGYGALLFDFRGHGQSDAVPIAVGDPQRRDLTAAVNFVAAQPGVEWIGGLGFSMGAATMIQVAAKDDRLRAVVAEASFARFSEVIDDKARLLGPLTQWPSRWAVKHAGVEIDDMEPVDDLCAISPRPILLIYGSRDRFIPPGTAQSMFDAACDPVEKWLIDGAAHENYAEAMPVIYGERLIMFFDRAVALYDSSSKMPAAP